MMNAVPFEHGLIVTGILFTLGVLGLLRRRNIIFTLISIEVMMNAAGFAFVLAGNHWKQTDGQIMFIFILTVAASEVAVGLALLLQYFRHFKTLEADAASNMNG